MRKRFIPYSLAALAVIITACAFLTPYNSSETDTTVAEREEAAVWYNEPVSKMYDKNGAVALVSYNDAEKYIAGGWSDKPPVREGLDDLKNDITAYISTRGGDWGVYIKNMKTREYISVNEHEYTAASLIKLFTAAAVYNETAAGTLKTDDALNRNLELMLCESDNHACNYLTERLGGGSAARGFDIENKNTQSLGCEYTSHKSEIVDGGKITSLGRNSTSPRDCGRLLELIYYGTMVSESASASMLDLLLNQTRTWKIPAGLPGGTRVANKTGETDTVQGDAAIVYSPRCNYIICVIGNGNVGGGIDTIVRISKMTYEYFNP